MDNKNSLSVRFWGTRGSMTPRVPSSVFGIHTTAMEVQHGSSRPVFIDLGTGALPAAQFALQNGLHDFDILMTHLHIDHICGALSYSPFYHSDLKVCIRGAHDIEKALRVLVSPPFFPIDFEEMQAQIRFERLPTSGKCELPDQKITLSWGNLAHPQGSTAFRFDDGINALVFATDVEIGPDIPNPDLEKLLSDPYPAGLAIIDGFFTVKEMQMHKGWGHSSWREACQLARKAGVEQIVITHHHPKCSDQDLSAMEERADDGVWAREGQVWTLRGNHAEVDQGSVFFSN